MSGQVEAYGSSQNLTVVDRFGVWLSARKLRRTAGGFAGRMVADIGCGFDATFSRTIVDLVSGLVLVDVSLAPDLKQHPKVKSIEGDIPGSLETLTDGSLDVVMLISVLEHLSDPLATLREIHRLLAPGGRLLLNVPSWRGKWFLELSAFRLGLSPVDSIDDHKCYYDPQDLWPLLVSAGFRPKSIKCRRHKFGLNTFAVCSIPGD